MLRLGFTAFGGPAAHVAMMRDEVVTRRKWVTEQQFLDLLGASGLIPGPTSTEMAIHLGMTRAGWRGLWVAGACFITPAVLITLAFAWAYVAFGALPASQGLLYGVKPAVVAVVLAAVLQLGRTAVKSVPLGVVTVATLALYAAGVSEVALLLGAGLVGVLLARPWRPTPPPAACLLWLGSGVTAAGGAAAKPGAWELFLYFLKTGSLLFGSGYVLLAFVRQGLVHDLGWLTERQLVDAVAVGQFTPGPLFSTATFIGYVVGERYGFGGWTGAAVASAGIFLPSFMLEWVTHSLVRRLREAPASAAFLNGLNAGSVGLMAGVLLQLGAAALVDVPAWLLFGVCALLQLRWKVNSAWLVLGAALVGLALRGGR